MSISKLMGQPRTDHLDVGVTRNRIAPSAPGSVLYLPGVPGNGVTIFDLSGQGDDGTITGGTWARLPSGLWYVDLDGSDDYIDCGAATAIYAITGNFTCKIWARMDAASADVCGLFTAGSGRNGLSNDDAGEATVRARIRSDEPASYSTGYVTMTLGTWHHLVQTYDSIAVRIYQDATAGTPEAAADKTILCADDSVRIGYDAVAANRYWNGGVALEEWCTGAWTQAQVTSSYNRERHLFLGV